MDAPKSALTHCEKKRIKPPDPARQAAGRAAWAKRRGFTAEGLQRLREAAMKNRPWEHSTGPRTAEGKLKVANNGRKRQAGPVSKRQLLAELAATKSQIGELAAMRRALFAGQPQAEGLG